MGSCVRGRHIHHYNFGIALLAIVGAAAVQGDSSTRTHGGLATAYGAGMALIVDELALLLDLQDVYWATDGRKSVDAAVLIIAAGGLYLTAAPFWRAAAREIARTSTDVVTRPAASSGAPSRAPGCDQASPKMNQRVASSLAVQPSSPRSDCNSSARRRPRRPGTPFRRALGGAPGPNRVGRRRGPRPRSRLSMRKTRPPGARQDRTRTRRPKIGAAARARARRRRTRRHRSARLPCEQVGNEVVHIGSGRRACG